VYQLGMDGTLNAVSPDGGLQWATPLEGTVWDPHPGTPIITADGTVFVAFGDLGPDGAFHVASDGGILSAIPPAASTDGFDLPPMLTNGGLLLGSDDGFGAFGFQINANGSFQVAVEQAMGYSKYQGGDQISAVVGPDDSTYWCGGEICTALSPPGAGFAIEWGPVDAANGNSAASDLALDESFTGDLMILVGGWKYDTGGPGTGSQSLVAMEPQTGTVVWTATLPPPAAAQQEPVYFGIGDATVGNSCPAIGSDGTVYVGNFDGLHAFTFTGTGAGVTGTEKNGTDGSPPFFPTGADDILTAPAIGGDGTIFFGTAGGKFYAVNPDGSLRFQLTAGGRIAGSPAIGPSGAVYFTADDGYLYAVN
jgi:outer membrane protein assembly factor BamB